MPAFDDQPDPRYRPCVGIVLLNSDGLVFVAQRIDTPGAWQMPQGGIDPGETPRAAALRELREETGTDNAEIIAEAPGWLRYDLPSDIAASIWSGRYVGQTQKWFAMRFTGSDADIDLSAHVREFDAWKWAPMEDLPELIVPFKRRVYERVVAAFKHLARR